MKQISQIEKNSHLKKTKNQLFFQTKSKSVKK
jgi:hypothetical protein